MKSYKSLEAVYIYIIGFNEIDLCKYRKRPMLFRRI